MKRQQDELQERLLHTDKSDILGRTPIGISRRPEPSLSSRSDNPPRPIPDISSWIWINYARNASDDNLLLTFHP
jgi:hypothetical protein